MSPHPRGRIWPAPLRSYGYRGALLAFLCAAQVANAAPPPTHEMPSDLNELELEQLMTIDVAEVQSASKYTQRVTEAPASVSIISADEISRFGARTLSDILRMVRGFYPTSDRNYNYTGTRGFGRPSDFDSRLLIMVDGHRLNDGVYDYGASGTDFIVDVGSIERVEIIRGPGSSLYGTNAFFAVINVITRRGRDVHAVEVAGDYGSFDARRGRISVGSRFAEGADLYLTGTTYESGGNQALYFANFDDPTTNNGIARHNDSDGFQNVLMNLTWGDFAFEGAYVNRDKHFPTGAYDVIFNDPGSRTRDQKSFLAGTYRTELAQDVGFEVRAGYDWYEYQGFYPFNISPDPSLFDRVVNEDRTHAERAVTEAIVTAELTKSNRLLAGVEYRDDFRLDQENFNSALSETLLDVRGDQQVWAVYVQDEYRILNNLTLLAGVRHDDYSTFGGTTNPRMAVVYNPVENSAIKLLYGSAFRAPNGFETLYNDFAGNYEKNPDLQPEEIDTYEVVFERYFSREVHGSVSAFYYDIAGLINQVENPDTGRLRSENSSSATARGLEFEVEGRWSSGWYGRASYTFTETEDGETGARLSNSPRHVAMGLVSIPLVAEKLFLSPALFFVSQREASDFSQIASYPLVNTTLLYHTPLQGLDASLSFYNLLDRTFSDPVGGEFPESAVQQDGRVFRLQAVYRYDLE